LLPIGLLTFEISLQYKRKPDRCHRTTVSGVTTMRACVHFDQNRCMATQKSLSNRFRLGRGCRRFSTASCCRSTKFSTTRSRRLRKRRARAPNQNKNTLNMVGVITERWRRGSRYVIHFKVGESFGEAQGKKETLRLPLHLSKRRPDSANNIRSFRFRLCSNAFL